MEYLKSDLITIEYSPWKKESALIYFKILNADPILSKAILNGIDIIRDEDIELMTNSLDTDNKILTVFDSILRKNGVNKSYHFTPEISNLYFSLNDYLKGEELSDRDKLDLALYYYYKNRNTSYIIKQLYGGGLNEVDNSIISNYILYNYSKELLQFSIHFFKTTNEMRNDFFTSNLEAINDLLCNPLMGEDYKIISYYNNNYSIAELFEKINNISKIIPNDFEKYVVGIINYIDSSGELLQLYYKKKQEHRFRFNRVDNADNHNNQYFVKEDILSIDCNGTIHDIIVFMHEFGHMAYQHYCPIDDGDKILITEYPSIYFELMAQDYLTKIGFKDAEEAMIIRNITNLEHYHKTGLMIYLSIVNKDNDYTKYDVSSVLPQLSRNKVEELGYDYDYYYKYVCINTVMDYMHYSSNPIDIIKTSRYLIGSYLARYSMNNFDIKTSYNMIKNVAQFNYSFKKILSMHGIVDKGARSGPPPLPPQIMKQDLGIKNGPPPLPGKKINKPTGTQSGPPPLPKRDVTITPETPSGPPPLPKRRRPGGPPPLPGRNKKG